ncbi:reticulon-4-interacting protein 1, mitochondrial isoform X2 [Cephus cinctus]|nr:reticulon-4-interacting protein 1, mitochondrial isoform X2 [Cephus cinctus]XP_015603923.1 reticulon-4-interacting protein 1, mitochondrial isoform X2 [Cephus cinctus]XP_015603924.1 reticulon-4-interacting protein 1, mitochondrial isoform X2 [Cephus cinctus]
MWSTGIRVFNRKSVLRASQLRYLARLSVKYKENPEDKMQAWQIHSYGNLDELKLSTVRMPVITKPTEVLIKVEASSVNPIDVAMMKGYGAMALNLMRKAKNVNNINSSGIEFPLIMGRDFSGVVISKGHGVGDRLKLGDKVWGVVSIEQQGCHSSHVVVDNSMVNPRPENLSYIEAASILYAGLTAWSALWWCGGLSYKTSIATRMNRRMLVLGGSGGVGTLAIQLLKAWNMHVITTCSSDAVNVLKKLGADVVIDYKQDDADRKIFEEGPYDIILDCCNQGIEQAKAKGYQHESYITLNSPLLKNLDEHGLIGGMIRNISDFCKHNLPKAENKSTLKWAFFTPSSEGLNMIQEFVENGKLVPVVKKVYPFQELPKAYERVSLGHLRGKIVIDMK